jgi:uncharacterized protein YbjT (DUF2867 family)
MRLIHLSALGASLTSPAISDRTKAEGEQAVRAVFPQATIVRPSELTLGDLGVQPRSLEEFLAVLKDKYG